jgi:predicted RecB family nuclease
MEYCLDQTMGKKNRQTYWEFYAQTKEQVENLLNNQVQNKPALAGSCKLCPWYKSCKKWCQENHDLTNIFYLGRAKRDMLNEDLHISKVRTPDLLTNY